MDDLFTLPVLSIEPAKEQTPATSSEKPAATVKVEAPEHAPPLPKAEVRPAPPPAAARRGHPVSRGRDRGRGRGRDGTRPVGDKPGWVSEAKFSQQPKPQPKAKPDKPSVKKAKEQLNAETQRIFEFPEPFNNWIHVSNLPLVCTEVDLMDYLNTAAKLLLPHFVHDTNPVVQAKLMTLRPSQEANLHTKKGTGDRKRKRQDAEDKAAPAADSNTTADAVPRTTAIVRLSSVVMTTKLLLALCSATEETLPPFNGTRLVFRRPDRWRHTEYPLGVEVAGIGNRCSNTSETIFIGGIPTDCREEQVLAVLGWFGKVRCFNLMREEWGDSKGYGFFEFEDPASLAPCIAELNGKRVDWNKRLKIEVTKPRRTLAAEPQSSEKTQAEPQEKS
eukprot:TRINITY_DN9015_c0_g1_i1.p1 TRINITY_DN9015_c0_g1~~TRINITY_DN9015_c0_g1_i1.p1  ORF type:complete len:396 (-),score=71.42 TRINITY_DN9015_c0_g1_i1:168-1334(-)